MTLAEGFNAAIIGFSVRANKEAAAAAKRNGIEIRYYNIIYDLVDDVKKAMSGLLAPTLRETMLGNASILEIFNISKVGKVAGCRVTDGTVANLENGKTRATTAKTFDYREALANEADLAALEALDKKRDEIIASWIKRGSE